MKNTLSDEEKSTSSSSYLREQRDKRTMQLKAEGKAGVLYGKYGEGKIAQIERNESEIKKLRENYGLLIGSAMGFLYKAPTRIKGALKMAASVPTAIASVPLGIAYAATGLVTGAVGIAQAVGGTLLTPVIGRESAMRARQNGMNKLYGGLSMVTTGVVRFPVGAVSMALQGAYNLVTGRESSWKTTGGTIDRIGYEMHKISKNTGKTEAIKESKAKDAEIATLTTDTKETIKDKDIEITNLKTNTKNKIKDKDTEIAELKEENERLKAEQQQFAPQPSYMQPQYMNMPPQGQPYMQPQYGQPMQPHYMHMQPQCKRQIKRI